MNRAQRRAAARNHPTPHTDETGDTGFIKPSPYDPATLALIGRLSECPDCCADTELVQPSPGVHVLEVRHDETCPTYRSMQGDGHA